MINIYVIWKMTKVNRDGVIIAKTKSPIHRAELCIIAQGYFKVTVQHRHQQQSCDIKNIWRYLKKVTSIFFFYVKSIF